MMNFFVYVMLVLLSMDVGAKLWWLAFDIPPRTKGQTAFEVACSVALCIWAACLLATH